MNAVDLWKYQNSTMEACNASCSRSDQQIHGTFRQAADHSNSATEARASGSYPDHSNSAMEAQASDSYPAASTHTNEHLQCSMHRGSAHLGITKVYYTTQELSKALG